MENGLQQIQNKIYEICGYKVMLDHDLAEMYQTETKRVNEAVKRNIRRFPTDFMFELTKEEWDHLKSQIATSSWGGIRKLPKAFTEQGVAMLSGLLNSDVAIQVNINIMRAFVVIRQLVINAPTASIDQLKQEIKAIKGEINEILAYQNDINEDNRTQLELINERLADLHVEHKEMNRPRNPIGYIVPSQQEKK